MGADQETLLSQTASIVASYVTKTSVPVSELPQLIQQVHGALAGVEPKPKPAVTIKKWVALNNVIRLETGRNAQMLKRLLSLAHDLTPQEHRQKRGLPNYLVVAQKYAQQRSEIAKKFGFGRKPKKGRRMKR